MYFGVRVAGGYVPAPEHQYPDERSALNAADVLATQTNRDHEVVEYTITRGWDVPPLHVVPPGKPWCMR